MSLGACGELLAHAVAVLADGRTATFLGAAIRLVAALPGDLRANRCSPSGVAAPVWSPVSSSIC